ncbi:hypothetical protein [Gorillibacterium sp. sgz5001074]|uniref:hypothetical protein n=1 Tax=Gorillibacterium sp. sgz5001074 TaxID=3446695 RepID=UPI003F6731CF
MLHKRKSTLLLAVLMTASLTAAGCSEENHAKERMDQALTKQAEMKSYSFTGNADLNLEMPSQKEGSNPMTSALLTMFMKGKLEWNGAASTDPVRFETDLKSTPAGSAAALELPVLFKDNKLFLHIPMLNKDGEYYSVDMAELAKLSGQANPMSPDSLKNISKTMSDAAKLAISDVNPKWFAESDAGALKDGTKAVSYRLDITDKNRKEITDALKAKWPQLADTLKSSGIFTGSQAEEWKAQSATLDVKAPGSIEIKVDSAGFIREQNVSLSLSYQGKDGKGHSSSFRVAQAYNDVNQSPKFQKEEPKNARPLSEILKLIMPPKTTK